MKQIESQKKENNISKNKKLISKKGIKRLKIIEIARKQKERLADLMNIVEERRNQRKKQKI